MRHRSHLWIKIFCVRTSHLIPSFPPYPSLPPLLIPFWLFSLFFSCSPPYHSRSFPLSPLHPSPFPPYPSLPLLLIILAPSPYSPLHPFPFPSSHSPPPPSPSSHSPPPPFPSSHSPPPPFPSSHSPPPPSPSSHSPPLPLSHPSPPSAFGSGIRHVYDNQVCLCPARGQGRALCKERQVWSSARSHWSPLQRK